MDFKLSEHEKMIQRTASDFAERSVRPLAMEIDRKCEFPFELAREMGSIGYFGLPYPPEYGGGGAGYISYVLVIEQLCRAAMVAGAIIGVNGLAEESIFRYGSKEQKQRFLVPLAKGEKLSSFAFTEAATGSDPTATIMSSPVRSSLSPFLQPPRWQWYLPGKKKTRWGE